MGVLLWSSAVLAAPESQVLEPAIKLPNDLVWLFLPPDRTPLVTWNSSIKAGTLTTPPGKEGLANLTASLLSNTAPNPAPRPRLRPSCDFMGARFFSRRRR